MKLYRVEGVINLKAVTTTKIMVIGLGSLGSLAMANLAYPWRQIVLVDPDELSPANVERHLLGASKVGQPKVDGIKDWLIDRNVPAANIVTHHGVAEDILERHTDTNLIVVAIDKRSSRDNINAWCLYHQIPAFYGGVYPQGSGGHIMVIPTPDQQCYRCAEHLMGGNTLPQQPDTPQDYGVDISLIQNEEGDLKAVSALRAPINAIATDLAQLILSFIKQGSIEPQVFIHAFDEWEEVALVPPTNPYVKALNQTLWDMTKHTALMPNQQLKAVGNTISISRRNGTDAFRLQRWSLCPLHQAAVALEAI